ncbi:MAG TPA: hypothetical protein VKB45_06960 [Gemmatimonadales bacterium]|nr:hypothetical protein [Gemmatimonadales bacterium]
MSATKGLVFATLLVTTACAYNPAPGGFLPGPSEAGQDGYGAWIEVGVPVAGRSDTTITGELIAASADTLWILPDSGRVAAVPTRTVRNGQVARYRSEAGSVAGFTALGVVSTISNGAFLLLTAPAWLITGIVASSNESHAPLRHLPPRAWADLAADARFPQGLPPGIDLGEIRPKPGIRKASASNP